MNPRGSMNLIGWVGIMLGLILFLIPVGYLLKGGQFYWVIAGVGLLLMILSARFARR